MKIAFAQETVNQNVGLMYLAALVKQRGHACELFVEPLESDFFRALLQYKPDLVGFSVITGAHHWVAQTARRIKEFLPKTLIVLGGPHPTYFPQVLEDSAVDVVARGEADISFPDLVDCLGQGRAYHELAGLWVKSGGRVFKNEVAVLVDDLSSLPHPDRGLYLKYPFFANMTEVPFSTMRGCPFRCAFCYNHVKMALYRGKGRYLRVRRVADIIAEMEETRRLFPKMQSVILYDDIIGLDKQWLAEFSAAYAERIGLPWFTSIRADFVDEFTAEELRKAKAFCLSIGVETGDEELRRRILGKNISDQQYLKAAGLLKAAGIKVRTSNMLFLPGEDVGKALKTVDLNRAMQVDFAWAYTLQPYPGTGIYDDAVKNGYLSAAFQFDDIDPLGLVKPIVKVKDEKKILVVHRFFMLAVKSGVVRRLLNVLIYIGPNPLFNAIYSFSLVLSYAEYHQVNFFTAFKIAWNNYWSTRRRGQKR
ncbi:MAG: B12-binding domain-containing radical SAM protein [Lentisphaerae bacterium]|nr:B12-binding domain-containing radical SAM protein [Lentisphaerota bacterium]